MKLGGLCTMDGAALRMALMVAITAHALCEKIGKFDGIARIGSGDCKDCATLYTYDPIHGRSLQEAKLPQVERQLLSAARDGDVDGVHKAIQSGATGNVPTSSQLFTPLIFAARGGHNEVVVVLLGAGVNPNWQTRSGITALWIAAFQGHKDVVASLLTLGKADPDIADSDGKTPLYVASQEKHADVVEVLLSKGANSEAQSKSGVTPLLVASRSGDPVIVELLADEGADVDPTSKDLERSALWTATFEGHLDVVKMLISKGANLNLAAKDGSTPLFAAAQQGWDIIASELLDAGAGINLKRQDGLTPLHIAVVHGHLKVVQLLVQGGAGMMIRDSRGRTAADLLLLKDVDGSEEIETALGLPSTKSVKRELEIPSIQPVATKETPPPPVPVLESAHPPRQPQDGQAPRSTTPILEPQPLVQLTVDDPRVLHSPKRKDNDRRKASTTKMAIIIPSGILGIALIVLIALFFVKLSRPKEEEVQRIVTKLVPDSENSYDIHDGLGALGALGDTYGSGQMESMQVSIGGTPNMIDVTFEETGIGMTPHRFGMETRRSHILMDGPSSLQGSARKAEGVELEPKPDHRVSKTWNWASDDGPSDEAGEGGIVATYKEPHVPRPSQGVGLDSSLLHEELRLDHQLAKMEREPWWKSSRYQGGLEAPGDMWSRGKIAEPHGEIRQMPKNSAKVIQATYTPASHHEALGSDVNMASLESDYPNLRKAYDDSMFNRSSQDLDEREVLGRRVRRSRSEELFYCMGDGDSKKVSGSSVWMTADEGAGACVAGEERDRKKRLIRVLYKGE